MLQEAGPRLGEAFVLWNAPLEPFSKHIRHLILNMPAKEMREEFKPDSDTE